MPSIQQMQANLTRLDTYTQLSVLGSWAFTVNAACINQAMRFVPDEPIDNGIEHFTQYEAARRALIKEAEDSNRVPALIALQRELTGMIYEADGQARGLEDTLGLLTENAPKRAAFESDYDNRVRMGMKPGMSKRQFVAYEYERAMNQHNQLVAKGEHAVRLCDTITVDDGRGYNDLPEWVTESFERKFIEKLHMRWEKLDLVRTNPRKLKQIRDAAAADQMQIEAVLNEYGEQPGFIDDNDIPDPSDAQIMRDEAKSLMDMPNDNPYAPGPVTVTRFRRAPAPTA